MSTNILVRITDFSWAITPEILSCDDSGVKIAVLNVTAIKARTEEDIYSYIQRALPKELFERFFFQGPWRGEVYSMTLCIGGEMISVWAAQSRIPEEIKKVFGIKAVPPAWLP